MIEKEIIIKKCIAGEITKKQPSLKFRVTERTVANIKKRFLKEGAGAFIHKNTSKSTKKLRKK